MAAKKKTAKKTVANKAKGKRYTGAEKAKVLAMVDRVNAEKGRGGITAASEKFGVTPLTISAWMRKAGGTARGTGRSQATPEVFRRLAELHEMIVETEGELSDLQREYTALKCKL